jgi:hypothetical protein
MAMSAIVHDFGKPAIAIIRDAEEVEVFAGVEMVMPEPLDKPAVVELNLRIVGAGNHLWYDLICPFACKNG